MFHYNTTLLEDYIQNLYQELGIHSPCQIDMYDIAEKLNIWIYFMDMGSKAIYRGEMKSMLIDQRLSPPEQWQDFGHELCHLIRQAGVQTYMPESILYFQETKADHFMYEFCVPSFMLIDCSLPDQRTAALQYVAETFNVTKKFAELRLKQIEKRMFASQLNYQFTTAIEAENQFIREMGCDYVIRGRQGSALYSTQKGLLSVIKYKENY
ncbi:ImmA/IrrE family metallo-endopeptidase [Caldalkalibacillus mannanilyticus]|uniref:ImmA/IrrE family metallo-endopeptidase n=1 Tax=Caldalkalibacillus mannanilyticus TaxID=1418 RepID=UPI00046AFBC5